MKKLFLAGVLSVLTLVGANLPGLEATTASAAAPSSPSVSESGNKQQILLKQQRHKYQGM